MRSYLIAGLFCLIAPVALAIAPPVPAIARFSVSPDNTLVIWEFNGRHSRPADQFQWSFTGHPHKHDVYSGKAHQPFPSYICDALTVYKTELGRERKAILKVPQTEYCQVIHMENTLFVAANGGVFRSQNEGKTFQLVPNSGPYHRWDFSFVQVGGNMVTAWAQAPGQAAMGPLLSTDAGNTWRMLKIPYSGGTVVSPANGKLFAMTNQAVLRSDDLGVTWVADDKGIPFTCRNFRVVGAPDGTFYAWSQEAVFFREANEKRWSRLGLPKSIGLNKDAC